MHSMIRYEKSRDWDGDGVASSDGWLKPPLYLNIGWPPHPYSSSRETSAGICRPMLKKKCLHCELRPRSSGVWQPRLGDDNRAAGA